MGHPQGVRHSSPASVSTGLCKAMPKCSLLISAHLTQVMYQPTLLLPLSLSLSPIKHPLRQGITLGHSLPQAGDPFPQLKHSDLHQWGNLALNVKIHPGIQQLTNILRLEEIKYWSSPTSTGKQMS